MSDPPQHIFQFLEESIYLLTVQPISYDKLKNLYFNCGQLCNLEDTCRILGYISFNHFLRNNKESFERFLEIYACKDVNKEEKDGPYTLYYYNKTVKSDLFEEKPLPNPCVKLSFDETDYLEIHNLPVYVQGRKEFCREVYNCQNIRERSLSLNGFIPLNVFLLDLPDYKTLKKQWFPNIKKLETILKTILFEEIEFTDAERGQELHFRLQKGLSMEEIDQKLDSLNDRGKQLKHKIDNETENLPRKYSPRLHQIPTSSNREPMQTSSNRVVKPGNVQMSVFGNSDNEEDEEKLPVENRPFKDVIAGKRSKILVDSNENSVEDSSRNVTVMKPEKIVKPILQMPLLSTKYTFYDDEAFDEGVKFMLEKEKKLPVKNNNIDDEIICGPSTTTRSSESEIDDSDIVCNEINEQDENHIIFSSKPIFEDVDYTDGEKSENEEEEDNNNNLSPLPSSSSPIVPEPIARHQNVLENEQSNELQNAMKTSQNKDSAQTLTNNKEEMKKASSSSRNENERTPEAVTPRESPSSSHTPKPAREPRHFSFLRGTLPKSSECHPDTKEDFRKQREAVTGTAIKKMQKKEQSTRNYSDSSVLPSPQLVSTSARPNGGGGFQPPYNLPSVEEAPTPIQPHPVHRRPETPPELVHVVEQHRPVPLPSIPRQNSSSGNYDIPRRPTGQLHQPLQQQQPQIPPNRVPQSRQNGPPVARTFNAEHDMRYNSRPASVSRCSNADEPPRHDYRLQQHQQIISPVHSYREEVNPRRQQPPPQNEYEIRPQVPVRRPRESSYAELESVSRYALPSVEPIRHDYGSRSSSRPNASHHSYHSNDSMSSDVFIDETTGEEYRTEHRPRQYRPPPQRYAQNEMYDQPANERFFQPISENDNDANEYEHEQRIYSRTGYIERPQPSRLSQRDPSLAASSFSRPASVVPRNHLARPSTAIPFGMRVVQTPVVHAQVQEMAQCLRMMISCTTGLLDLRHVARTLGVEAKPTHPSYLDGHRQYTWEDFIHQYTEFGYFVNAESEFIYNKDTYEVD